MITDIDLKKVRKELNLENLADYWQGYFYYKDSDSDLYELASERISAAVAREKERDTPFIDSQQVIGSILSDFGTQHVFHRQFNENFPDMHPNQILGMHLYDLMMSDDKVWIYQETQHTGHLFPHATYFMAQNS